MLGSIVRNWWIVLVRGIFAVSFGILAFAWPRITLASLVVLFGIYAIIDGVSSIAVGIARGAGGTPWWQMVPVGIVSVIAGVLTLLWPGVTAVVLLVVIAAWLILGGIVEIYAAIRLRALIENEWLLILSGAFSILFGTILIARPGAGALAVLLIIGSCAIVLGLLAVALAFRLRSLKTHLADVAGLMGN
jgi:uncharacterized membrane protein HdeD (DUF308 family)